MKVFDFGKVLDALSWICLDSSSWYPWSSQGCWAGLHPWLEHVQWMLRGGKPNIGFTPACTMAKGLVVACSFPPSLQSKELPDSHLHCNRGILVDHHQLVLHQGCQAESVCPPSLLRMVSDSGSISPGPECPDWKLEKSENWEDSGHMNCNHTR